MKYYLVYLLLFVLGGAALAVALQSGRARNVKWLLGAAFCGAMGFYLWHVTVGEFVDYILGGYYHAGGAILDDPRSLYQGTSLKFVNLPLVAFIFTPLHGLTPLGGAQVLAACCAAAVAVFVALALRIGDALPEAGPRPQRELLLLWMCAAFGPLLYGIRLANITALLLPLMALALLVQPRRPAMTGALLAVCAVLKLPLLLFGPWLLVRHPRAGAGFWATLAALFALSVVLCGWDVNQDFIREVILEHVGTTFGAYNVQSISGTLAHLLPSNNLYVFTGVHRGLPFKAVQMAVTLVLLTPVAWYFLRGGVPRSPRAFQLEFAAVLCAALLISPLTWVHYYSLCWCRSPSSGSSCSPAAASLARAAASRCSRCWWRTCCSRCPWCTSNRMRPCAGGAAVVRAPRARVALLRGRGAAAGPDRVAAARGDAAQRLSGQFCAGCPVAFAGTVDCSITKRLGAPSSTCATVQPGNGCSCSKPPSGVARKYGASASLRRPCSPSLFSGCMTR